MQHSLIFAVVCILLGAALLYDVPGRDAIQAETIAGAAVLSFGAVTLGIVLKDWLRWKRELGKYREG